MNAAVSGFISECRQTRGVILKGSAPTELVKYNFELLFVAGMVKFIVGALDVDRGLYLICGEKGGEALDLALYAAAIGNSKQAYFTEIRSDNYSACLLSEVIHDVSDSYRNILYFDSFDSFTTEQKKSIFDQLSLISSEHFSCKAPSLCLQLVFSVCSVTPELKMQINQLGEVVELFLPPLRHRPSDIPELIEEAYREFRRKPQQSISPKVTDWLIAFQWPGNTQQLRRSIARLLFLSDQDTIEWQEAQLILPDIFPDESLSITMEALCRRLLLKQDQLLDRFHPAVRKSMIFLSKNFNKDLSLAILAAQAHSSSSHLSYLFRISFSVSFKQLLNMFRVIHARQQLEVNPQIRITDLYLDAGFGDLSHFEKIFKRYTGKTPNEYRKQLRPIATIKGELREHITI
jgi:AraC-like DNA-binding protein